MLVRRRHELRQRWHDYRTEWAVEEEIERIVARGRLLVAGPWTSEVGFETLYWLPFLRWAMAAFRLTSDRLVAVSRGGVGGWYAGIADRYLEIWDDMDPAEFARRNAARGEVKQSDLSDLDRDILAGAARRLGTRDFDVLHPGLMYRLFALYWSGQRALSFIDARTRFTTTTAAPFIDPARLPSDYIAVKLYAARSLPDTPDIRRLLRQLVAGLSQRACIVLLDTGLALADEHADYTLAGAQVTSARAWMTPQNNLGVQTQILAGARAFVGTCGSLAWLAPRLGTDTSALYVDASFLHAHLPVAMRAHHKLGAGRFAAADLRAVDPLAASGAATA